MISWRLIVPAVLVAAATAGCFTYFVTAPPPVEASPDIKGPDTRAQTFIDQRSRAEEEAKAVFERAAAAILRQAPELPMSHQPLSISPCQRSARYRAHDAHAISISRIRAKGLQGVSY